MKYSIFLLVMLYASFNTLAQVSLKPKGYYLNLEGNKIRVYQCKHKSNVDANLKVKIDDLPELSLYNDWCDKYWFDTIKTVKGSDGILYLEIEIPSITRWDSAAGKFLTTPNASDPKPWSYADDDIDAEDFNQPLFVAKSDFDGFKSEYYGYNRRVFVSAISTPYKYRFKLGTHSSNTEGSNVNLGGALGYRISGPRNKWGMNLIGFIGTGTYSMNSANNDSVSAKATQSLSGISYGGALIVDISTSQVQLGVVYGFDHAFGDLAKTYLYQDKPWIGLSLSFKFINLGSDDKQGKSH